MVLQILHHSAASRPNTVHAVSHAACFGVVPRPFTQVYRRHKAPRSTPRSRVALAAADVQDMEITLKADEVYHTP